ncbi:uncharacterized protein LOC132731817 [Ruditapes philippinarum]|uniref:uncharacterized protein LOC132731817 n=1 Tax=Ruditapes philippinarum TaxID=129788 RepID=UPI00295B8AB1|nr:uncharacterized protein LOC132731817 [Ruditapes philippinarum]
MRDFCDASYMKDLVRNRVVNGIFLQLVLYMDDIEIVNPIGSHTKKHKVTMIYFTLANIPPEFRSKYEAIQLLAVVKSQDVKEFGLGKILHDFVETMNRLNTTGIDFSVNDRNVTVWGGLIIAPADTPAAQYLGGFKEGVGLSNKVCRTCNTSRNEMKLKFLDADFQKRTTDQHLERLNLLTQMTTMAAKYWSKTWGINGRSPLLDIHGIDLAACLVQDPMHILTEGLLSKEVCLILYNFIAVEKYFTLAFLNNALGGFSYTYLEEKNKPEKIKSDDLLNGKLKQTSASLLILCCILPIVIGKKVPTENSKWKNFLRIVQITLLSTSPYASEDTAAELEQLIYTHHCEFKKDYPKSPLTPKFHYLVHIPNRY